MADTSISEVRICRMALSHVGADTSIESITEDSPEAKQCNVWYTFSRKQTLAVFDWNFARKRQTLATHSEAPPANWAYRYQYPSDCVKLRFLPNPAGPKADAIPFEVELSSDGETKTILTNLDCAGAVYTFDLVSTFLFSEMFVEMFSLALASHICIPITTDRGLKKDILDEFRQLARLAPAVNANERVEDAPRDAEHIRGRT